MNDPYANDPRYSNRFGESTGPGGWPYGGYSGNVSGPGGLSYSPITGTAAPRGLPAGLQGAGGYAGAANSIMQGTAAAESELRQSFQRMFAHRANAAVAGYGDNSLRMGAEAAAGGLSPEAVRRSTFAAQPGVMQQVGDAQATSEGELHQLLAQLFKGTGTELAGLKLNEIQTILQAYFGRKSLKAGEQAGWMNLAGNALGAAGAAASGGAFGGGGGAGASYYDPPF